LNGHNLRVPNIEVRIQNSEARINREWLLFIKMIFFSFILDSGFWVLNTE